MPFPVTFWSSPPAASSIALGRSNSASTSGAGGNYTIGWASGGAAANGTWIVLIARDNISNAMSVSGGSAWTQVGTSKCWYKQCGASEPTTYTITYTGGSKSDGGSATMLEITGASSMESSASSSSTNTPPSVTSTSASDIVVVAGGYGSGTTTVITAPSGYTTQSKRDNATVVTAIAAKTSAGSGTISPGAWSLTNSVTFQSVATLAFKP
jgi:hypothetical protein